jgi:hypothetical protein
MRKVILAGAILGGLIAPAAAQTVTEYYIVRNPETKRCTIVTERPTTTTTVIVGDRGFKTRTEAESGLKTTKICTSD